MPNSVDYLRENISNPGTFNKVVTNLKSVIVKSGIGFDAIAVRGISGLVVGAPLALRFKRPMIIVRKEGEGSHSKVRVEYGITAPSTKYIIVDDLIDSGDTIKTIIDSIDLKNWKSYQKMGIEQPKYLKDSDFECVGIFLYFRRDLLGIFNHAGKTYKVFNGKYAGWY